MKKIDVAKVKNELVKLTSKYKNYEAFSHKTSGKAYEFCQTIGVNICPYCNINYTYTIVSENNQKIIRPNLDHIECRTPANELQYDNLVLCCPVCNMNLKGYTSIRRTEYLHPYYDDFDEIVRISVNLKSPNYMSQEAFDVVFLPKTADFSDFKRAQNNISLFKLEERYQFHKDEVLNSFEILAYYHKEKINEINNLLDGKQPTLSQCLLSKDKNIDINQVSLGKLKKDIALRFG